MSQCRLLFQIFFTPGELFYTPWTGTVWEYSNQSIGEGNIWSYLEERDFQPKMSSFFIMTLSIPAIPWILFGRQCDILYVYNKRIPKWFQILVLVRNAWWGQYAKTRNIWELGMFYNEHFNGYQRIFHRFGRYSIDHMVEASGNGNHSCKTANI